MRSLNGFLFGIFAALALAACAGRTFSPFGSTLPRTSAPSRTEPYASQTVDWPTFGFNRQRWSYNGTESTLSTGTVKRLRLKWLVSVGTNVSNTQPILAANVTLPNKTKTQVVFAGDEDGRLTAVDALSGKVIWSKQLGKTSSGSTKMSASG